MFKINGVVNKSKNSLEPYEIVTSSNEIVGSFFAYDNLNHQKNKYIVVNDNLINHEEVFSYIRTYFNKPLQVMIDSTKLNIINTLLNAKFELVRRCYELEVFKTDLLERNYEVVSFKKTDKNEDIYNEISYISYKHYRETHESINPLNLKFEEFKKLLPNNLYYYITKDNIINYVFEEDGELCYFGGSENKDFEVFINSLLIKLFKYYSHIFFEIDSTDKIALRMFNLFNKPNESYNTFILK